MSPHAAPFYCPYCGEQDIRPGADEATFDCRVCQRSWRLTFVPGGAPATPTRKVVEGRTVGRAPTGYPAILILEGKTAVVIGGGAIVERKVQTLLDAGATVRLVSTGLTPRLRELVEAGTIEVSERAYVSGDLTGAAIAVAACDDPVEAQSIFQEASASGIPVNVVDDVPNSSFIAPSIIRRGDLLIAISTGGRGPALAVRLREKLEGEIGPEYATMLALLGDLRDDVRVPGDEHERRRRWYAVVDSDVFDLVRAGREDEARARARAILAAVDGPA